MSTVAERAHMGLIITGAPAGKYNVKVVKRWTKLSMSCLQAAAIRAKLLPLSLLLLLSPSVNKLTTQPVKPWNVLLHFIPMSQHDPPSCSLFLSPHFSQNV